MAENEGALIKELTNVIHGIVAVRPESIRYASGCFVCPQHEASEQHVRFTKTLILVVIGGIESTELVVPLCADHMVRYRRRMRLIDRVQMGCGLVVLLIFGVLFLASEYGAESYAATLVGAEGAPILLSLVVVCVVIAYLSIGFRSTALPVRFYARRYERLMGYGAYVFRFEDPIAAERFAVANAAA